MTLLSKQTMHDILGTCQIMQTDNIHKTCTLNILKNIVWRKPTWLLKTESAYHLNTDNYLLPCPRILKSSSLMQTSQGFWGTGGQRNLFQVKKGMSGTKTIFGEQGTFWFGGTGVQSDFFIGNKRTCTPSLGIILSLVQPESEKWREQQPTFL